MSNALRKIKRSKQKHQGTFVHAEKKVDAKPTRMLLCMEMRRIMKARKLLTAGGK